MKKSELIKVLEQKKIMAFKNGERAAANGNTGSEAWHNGYLSAMEYVMDNIGRVTDETTAKK